MNRTAASPAVAPPGAGLPWFQAIFGRYLWLPYLAASSSWEKCSRRFDQEGRRILDLVQSLGPEQMTRPVLVHGVIGIEDSSRFWSPAMVLEHLVITGDMGADIVVALTHGREPGHHVRIADLKPTGTLSPESALASFHEMLTRYPKRTHGEIGDPDHPRRWPHPWFGRLNAYGWHCLAGLHQGIHRRQMEAILAAG